MKGGTMYIRVVPQDRDRGYMILASWEKPVIQRTAQQLTTLGGVTRNSLNDVIAKITAAYNVGKLVDVTDKNVLGQLRKMFGEDKIAKDVDKPVA